MELLVLKAGGLYARWKEGELFLGPLEKASVFRPSEKNRLDRCAAEMKRLGHQTAVIRKLTITEGPLD